MKIVLLYVFPQVNQPVYGPAAKRFADSYMENPPGEADHEIVVCINGGTGIGPYQRNIFKPLPVTFVEHSNWAKDIGAFQMAAASIPCDLLVCFGANIHFHYAGWLDRIVRVFEENGPTLYGAWGFDQPRPHLRTTAFWSPPELLDAYPHQINDKTRYEFEHGSESITLWTQKMGFEPLMVTQSEVLPMKQWRHAGCEDSLFGDNHTPCL